MPFDEKIADRIREILVERTDDITEKKMFGGLCFMVNDKICVAVKSDRMLARLAPDVYEDALEQDGVTSMAHGTNKMTGYVYIDFEQLHTHKQLQHWINLALDFNPLAKAAKKKK